MNEKNTNVSKTYLPDRQRYLSYVNQIFDSGWITNNGRLHQELETKLAQYLGVEHLVLTSNATIALQIAYELLDVKKEAITTPFSFVATTSSLLWKGISPVFADIERTTLNIDPEQINRNVNSNTDAIVPVHTYGNACDIEAIAFLSQKHGIPVIYDASHCFGITYKGASILKQGAISVISFHATKIFNTVEGGALIMNSKAMYERAKMLVDNGIKDKETIPVLGANAKMSEFHAAMGLCILEEIDAIVPPRKKVHDFYINRLQQLPGITFPTLHADCNRNYSYFPMLLPSEVVLKNVEEAMNRSNIYPRRYFYPALNTLPFVKQQQRLPVVEDLATRILCLPLYGGLSRAKQEEIITIIERYVTK
ncbi:DegT/DnrJ/EryC1/StrS family aminotransferase [uncultured Kriegella sp.]|mgnify:CR=1 FL=1|uniref:DegT/DnrJ/EryC1/StrS family aminotransferase n=1 Tax=uncultured Kriegella sp. TaxID=1798910 RepID=UPI0030DD8647|tara:strand:+ start:7568 stop:8665 length:1098 start_codon:yes stop_codon:yes gene_type:complete